MSYISDIDKYKKEIILFTSVLHFKGKFHGKSSMTDWMTSKPKKVVTLKVVLKGELHSNKKVCKSYIYSCKPKNWSADRI